MNNFIENILIPFKINDKEIKNYSLLSLAFLGDSIHTLYIRNMLICKANFKIKELHTTTTKFVKAKSQSFVIENLTNLTQEEMRIVKSSKNAKTNNIAKNCTVEEYKNATSFEALLGYLALKQEYPRLNKILEESVKIIEKNFN